MWRTELATNTMTAERRIGSHSDIRGTIATSFDFRPAGVASRTAGRESLNRSRPGFPQVVESGLHARVDGEDERREVLDRQAFGWHGLEDPDLRAAPAREPAFRIGDDRQGLRDDRDDRRLRRQGQPEGAGLEGEKLGGACCGGPPA